MKPIGNAEIRRDFRHPCADLFGRLSETFKAKGKLMPNGIGHHTIGRILPDKADFLRFGTDAGGIERPSFK